MNFGRCRGNLAGQLVGEIDEYHLKVNPVLIGAGIPLLNRPVLPVHLELTSTRTLPASVQLSVYRRRKVTQKH